MRSARRTVPAPSPSTTAAPSTDDHGLGRDRDRTAARPRRPRDRPRRRSCARSTPSWPSSTPPSTTSTRSPPPPKETPPDEAPPYRPCPRRGRRGLTCPRPALARRRAALRPTARGRADSTSSVPAASPRSTVASRPSTSSTPRSPPPIASPTSRRPSCTRRSPRTRAGLTALRAEIEGDTDATELRADCRRIVDDHRVYVLLAPQVRLIVGARQRADRGRHARAVSSRSCRRRSTRPRPAARTSPKRPGCSTR